MHVTDILVIVIILPFTLWSRDVVIHFMHVHQIQRVCNNDDHQAQCSTKQQVGLDEQCSLYYQTKVRFEHCP